MYKYIIVILLGVGLSVLVSSFSYTQKKRVIFFGDSITELGVKENGYITLLRPKLGEDKFELIGKGISGNKIYDLYLRLKSDVLDLKPNVVVIYIGINDVWHKNLLKTGTDYDKFLRFYQALINEIKLNGSEVIICTPTVIGELKSNANEMDAELNKYSEGIRQLAVKNQLKLADLRSLFNQYIAENNAQNTSKNILTYDGVHLNNVGNSVLADYFAKILN
ncbi:SGNH/GDSL hydrolase family protein [Pedobacter flavus]|uniref:SGNH/GDSL hydrolase family protein n=1 Tax=Pedobacter flavus TaxID=3113906 RepID=A0ABU7GYL9_9SPHI|nr:SGNH/GDSL hydrolase family protein [Pedobacter sp. VNH31]MEE1884180.1 SGNH/GDSL hydrolase family protein [Pedobacter sp. VNH31]